MKLFILTITFLLSFATRANWSKYNGIDLYTPTKFNFVQDKKVVLWLHGCTQNARGFADFTHLTEEADEHGFLILAPEQSRLVNPLKCWNWFLPHNNRREGKALKKMVSVLQQLIEEKSLDEDNVIVGGFSAGGLLASNLAACYPDIFKAVLIHSGGPFDLLKKFRKRNHFIECPGVVKTPMRLNYVLISHGEKDHVASPQFAFLARDQFISFLEENGVAGNVELIILPEMKHAWSGSKEGSIFSSPNTFDVTKYFIEKVLITE